MKDKEDHYKKSIERCYALASNTSADKTILELYQLGISIFLSSPRTSTLVEYAQLHLKTPPIGSSREVMAFYFFTQGMLLHFAEYNAAPHRYDTFSGYLPIQAYKEAAFHAPTFVRQLADEWCDDTKWRRTILEGLFQAFSVYSQETLRDILFQSNAFNGTSLSIAQELAFKAFSGVFDESLTLTSPEKTHFTEAYFQWFLETALPHYPSAELGKYRDIILQKIKGGDSFLSTHQDKVMARIPMHIDPKPDKIALFNTLKNLFVVSKPAVDRPCPDVVEKKKPQALLSALEQLNEQLNNIAGIPLEANMWIDFIDSLPEEGDIDFEKISFDLDALLNDQEQKNHLQTNIARYFSKKMERFKQKNTALIQLDDRNIQHRDHEEFIDQYRMQAYTLLLKNSADEANENDYQHILLYKEYSTPLMNLLAKHKLLQLPKKNTAQPSRSAATAIQAKTPLLARKKRSAPKPFKPEDSVSLDQLLNEYALKKHRPVLASFLACKSLIEQALPNNAAQALDLLQQWIDAHIHQNDMSTIFYWRTSLFEALFHQAMIYKQQGRYQEALNALTHMNAYVALEPIAANYDRQKILCEQAFITSANTYLQEAKTEASHIIVNRQKLPCFAALYNELLQLTDDYTHNELLKVLQPQKEVYLQTLDEHLACVLPLLDHINEMGLDQYAFGFLIDVCHQLAHHCLHVATGNLLMRETHKKGYIDSFQWRGTQNYLEHFQTLSTVLTNLMPEMNRNKQDAARLMLLEGRVDLAQILASVDHYRAALILFGDIRKTHSISDDIYQRAETLMQSLAQFSKDRLALQNQKISKFMDKLYRDEARSIGTSDNYTKRLPIPATQTARLYALVDAGKYSRVISMIQNILRVARDYEAVCQDGDQIGEVINKTNLSKQLWLTEARDHYCATRQYYTHQVNIEKDIALCHASWLCDYHHYEGILLLEFSETIDLTQATRIPSFSENNDGFSDEQYTQMGLPDVWLQDLRELHATIASLKKQTPVSLKIKPPILNVEPLLNNSDYNKLVKVSDQPQYQQGLRFLKKEKLWQAFAIFSAFQSTHNAKHPAYSVCKYGMGLIMQYALNTLESDAYKTMLLGPVYGLDETVQQLYEHTIPELLPKLKKFCERHKILPDVLKTKRAASPTFWQSDSKIAEPQDAPARRVNISLT